MDKDTKADRPLLLKAEAAEDAKAPQKSDMGKQPDGSKTLFATYVHIGLVVSAYW